jgi:hypothetical protein
MFELYRLVGLCWSRRGKRTSWWRSTGWWHVRQWPSQQRRRGCRSSTACGSVRPAAALWGTFAVTRPEYAPDSGGQSLSWKAAAEELVRGSGQPYSIIRPGWLVDRPPRDGLRFGQGDLLEGQLSRQALADICIEVLRHRTAYGKTFEVVEGGDEVLPDWAARFAELESDTGWKKLVAK